MKHRETHPDYVDGCFACRIGTVAVAPSAMPSRGGGAEAAHINHKEQALTHDLAAYKRLRDNGLQPKQIDGSSSLEKSEISGQFDIDLGRVVPKNEQSRVREGFDFCRENGLMV